MLQCFVLLIGPLWLFYLLSLKLLNLLRPQLELECPSSALQSIKLKLKLEQLAQLMQNLKLKNENLQMLKKTLQQLLQQPIALALQGTYLPFMLMLQQELTLLYHLRYLLEYRQTVKY